VKKPRRASFVFCLKPEVQSVSGEVNLFSKIILSQTVKKEKPQKIHKYFQPHQILARITKLSVPFQH